MNKRKFYIIISMAAVVVMAVVFKTAYTASRAAAEDTLAKCWVMVKPGDYVNVRRTPDRKGQEVGFLESGDWFMTDGSSADGWIRCYGIGEYGEGWIYCGYVVTEEPKKICQNYVCVSNGRVAIRRWMGGPKVNGSCWLTNGTGVTVFYEADGWAMTSRGYVKAEYLEADPE